MLRNLPTKLQSLWSFILKFYSEKEIHIILQYCVYLTQEQLHIARKCLWSNRNWTYFCSESLTCNQRWQNTTANPNKLISGVTVAELGFVFYNKTIRDISKSIKNHFTLYKTFLHLFPLCLATFNQAKTVCILDL